MGAVGVASVCRRKLRGDRAAVRPLLELFYQPSYAPARQLSRLGEQAIPHQALHGRFAERDCCSY